MKTFPLTEGDAYLMTSFTYDAVKMTAHAAISKVEGKSNCGQPYVCLFFIVKKLSIKIKRKEHLRAVNIKLQCMFIKHYC